MSTTTTDADTEAEAQRILNERLAAGEDPEGTGERINDLDEIDAPVDHREWRFTATYEVIVRGEPSQQTFDRTYVQKPLSYAAMMEFTGLIGRKIDQAMAGPDGLSIDQMQGDGQMLPVGFGQDGQLMIDRSDFGGADALIRGIAKLASYIPEVILESQCIWLRVPRQERAVLVDIWSRAVDEGGMSMDDGEEMLTTFIDQNYEELERFFVQRLGRIQSSVTKARKRSQRLAE